MPEETCKQPVYPLGKKSPASILKNSEPVRFFAGNIISGQSQRIDAKVD